MPWSLLFFCLLGVGWVTSAKKIDLTTVLILNNENNNSTPHGRAIRFLDTSGQTFVTGGATTEYGTQVIGTRLENGHVLAHVLSTTSRVLFDSSKGSPYINEKDFLEGNNNILPTYTVTNTFYPSTFEWDAPSTREGRVLPNNGKLNSVTYFGFADFTTTVGDTIVFFKPSQTIVREIEPTLVEQIQPTKMFVPQISLTTAIEALPAVEEVEQTLVVKEEKRKTGKALLQDLVTVKQEQKPIAKDEPVTELSLGERKEEEEEVESETEANKEEQAEILAPLVLESSVSEQNLIYSTLYTTVKYLTTLFDNDSFKVESSVQVLSSSITPVLEENGSEINLQDDKSQYINRNEIDELNDYSFPIISPSKEEDKLRDESFHTTFTYYTTIFGLNSDEKILSRSEVIKSNIKPTAVQEVKENSKEVVPEQKDDQDHEALTAEDQISSESNLDEVPTLIQTSFTTFTFYTTMYMGETSEIISHLETVTRIISDTEPPSTPAAIIETTEALPTTYYTTFTYWTTLAKTNGTDLTTISREETHSSVVAPTITYAPVSFPSAIPPANDIEVTSLPPTDLIVATSTMEVEAPSSRLLSYEIRKITDAEGISTIQQTTSVILSTINGTETEIVMKSSDVVVDSKKEPPSTSSKYKVGLVRQIEGTQVSDGQTVHYISKIIGTYIDNRYAQVIESTSEFLNIPAPTQTVVKPVVKKTNAPVIEPSEAEIIEETEAKVFASKKRPSAPVIRPFATRIRPHFAPKKKLIVPSATVITVLTPTITATPALAEAISSRKFSRNFSSKKSHTYNSPSVRKGSSSKSSHHPLSSTSPSSTVPGSHLYKSRRPFHNSLSSRKLASTHRLSSISPSSTISTSTTSTTTSATTTQRSKFYRQRTNLYNSHNKSRSKRQVYGSFRNRYRSHATTTTTTTTTTPKPAHRIRGLKSRKESHTTFHTSRTPSTSNSRKYSSSTSGRRRISYNSGSPLYNNNNNSHGSGNSHNNHNNAGSSSSRSSRQRTPTRAPSKRTFSRAQNIQEHEFVPINDGKITVTYNVPKQTAIPVVNGQITEYKNILTASFSTEVVEPADYTTQIGKNGLITTVLKSSSSTVNDAFETEITNFVLHEKSTTTVTYTPTTIAGRKTSFSHVLPSTVYVVENVVETIRPQIGSNTAPLANILLSQLLLGNINQNAGIPQLPVPFGTLAPQPFAGGVPVTETSVRTTSYVTTLNDKKSTVLPLTFHGKEILTTIYDSSPSVVTATEYITETTVRTPSQQAPQQVNSLLLPLLLQQLQNQPQQQPLQTQLPQLQLQNQLPDLQRDFDTNNISDALNDQPSDYNETEVAPDQIRKKKARRKHQQDHIRSSSVVTLYVSGKRPGEFSTILSTVVEESPDYQTVGFRRRRELEEPTVKDTVSSILLQTSNDAFSLDSGNSAYSGIDLQTFDHNHKTQSLENVVGNVNAWYHQSDIFTNDYL